MVAGTPKQSKARYGADIAQQIPSEAAASSETSRSKLAISDRKEPR